VSLPVGEAEEGSPKARDQRGEGGDVSDAGPLVIAEPYTRQPGRSVPRRSTVSACAAILAGVHDDVPEDHFRFIGDIDEVRRRHG
jgi:hypothetical protein